MKSEFPVLDPCCGSKMFWFDKSDKRCVFQDIREESHTLCDGRTLNIAPDLNIDVTDMCWDNEQFYHIILDPPHLKNLGVNSWMAKKYGVLIPAWQTFIREAFAECFRVLKTNGTLVFKWNEDQIKVADILKLTDYKPLYGHKSGKNSKTHWIVFIK